MKQILFLLLTISLLGQSASLTAQTLDAAFTAEVDKLLQAHYKSDGSGAAVLVSR